MNEVSPPSIVDRYQRLIEISRDLASTLDLDTLLDRLVHAAAELIGAEAASILLYDETNQQLHFQAATNLSEPLRGIRVPLENSIAGWIISHRQPIIVEDVTKSPRHFAQVSQVTNIHTRSLMGVPMITKGQIIGVLEVVNKIQGQFTQEDQELLSALGAQAAVAIEVTRLFQQSDLISDLVHEIRTPLASMTIASQILRRRGLSPEQQEEMISTIQSETARLTELTTAFLDLARLESKRAEFQITTFDLQPLLEELVQIIHPQAIQRQIDVNLHLPEETLKLRGDRAKLKQALLNLMNNAVKYNQPQGTITVRAQPANGEILIQVQDTGLGIPEEEIPHLFEKFFRASNTLKVAPGTGLGLTITKKIIENHGGKIEVQSQLGVGTMFTTHLPAAGSGN